MSHTVSAVFTFKDLDSKNKFINFCNGETGLSVTRAWEGCQSIDCYESQVNPLQITIWQKWSGPAAHESYVKHRHDDGSFDFLGELISSPPEINPLQPVLFKTDAEQIEGIVQDMCNKDHTVGNKHMHGKCVFVRPSGNPLDVKGWNNMMSNDDVVVESNELLKINQLRINEKMAYVCYTTHGKFSYKGTSNDDVAIFTSVLEKSAGRWQVVFGQRSTGRKPTDAPPLFPENN
jgi:quinol monooxygenase YgiN